MRSKNLRNASLAALLAATAAAIGAGPASASAYIMDDRYVADCNGQDRDSQHCRNRTTFKEVIDTGDLAIDETKDPDLIKVGELRSVWKGEWQGGGGTIRIKRAKSTRLLVDSNLPVKFRVRWVAGNEAVAKSVKNRFEMAIYRKDILLNDTTGEKSTQFTLIERVKKDVTVDPKGLGGTKFKDGYLTSSAVQPYFDAYYRIEFRAKCETTGETLTTDTDLWFAKRAN